MESEKTNDFNRALTAMELRAFVAVIGSGQDSISKGARRLRRMDGKRYGIGSLALLYSVPRQGIIDAGKALEASLKASARERARTIRQSRQTKTADIIARHHAAEYARGKCDGFERTAYGKSSAGTSYGMRRKYWEGYQDGQALRADRNNPDGNGILPDSDAQWLGDAYARNYTRTLSANQKDVFYAELAARGFNMHANHERNALAKNCQECWRIAANTPRAV